MNCKQTRKNRENIYRLGMVLVFWTLVGVAMWQPWNSSHAAAGGVDPVAKMYRRPAPKFDLNIARGLPNLRRATGDQIQALNSLKSSAGAPNLTARWNEFGGSPDVIYDFASQPLQGTPEEAARSFVNQNAALFGVAGGGDLRLFNQTQALGGTLLRFQQTFNGIPVNGGGIGVVMNRSNQVVMLSGPFFRGVDANTQPSLSAAQARAAADADLARFAANVPPAVSNLLQTGLSMMTQQVGNAANVEPALAIYPTADGYRLVWKVGKFSTNPFGLYVVSVDAHTGEIVGREDFVNYQAQPVLPLTADIYPKYPRITDELKNQGVISICGDRPCDQVRANLRKFDPSNAVTGLNGTLTGTHTIVNNALATKQPFAQAALGTWHFAKNDPLAFEARTNEQDQFAEPAEHQDEINAFFFTTYLLEYVDYLHRGGDPGTFGSTGAFPDEYPNSSTPLPATVHIPDVVTAITGGEYPPPDDPEFVQKVLGLDNAFALNLTAYIEGITGQKSPVVVNPTSYGHGFYFNDTALEGTVPYHEGMHAITSPIAGLEGPEGNGMNEGQADMWAFTITNHFNIGEYVINGYRLRQRYRELNRDPDSIGYIRTAKSSLKFSDVATYRNPDTGVYEYEEHRDGEIYMSTMWDIREMLNRMYPQTTGFARPQPEDGQPVKPITKGTNIFERDFLGSMYILGTMNPDTFVKARDAMIVADQLLYSTDPTDASAPGKHRALIEQMFAAKELGVNATESIGGVPTISTQVTPFAANQAAPAIPTNITAVPASTRSIKVSWQGVPGAIAYEVLKRKTALAGQREPNGIRAYNDGDASTTGYRHVAYAAGSAVSYTDEGRIREVFTPAGISDLFDSEYVVRSIGVNSTGQIGFSEMSGSSRPNQARQDLTQQVDAAISNISFSNGVMAFDSRLTNARGALSPDKTIYRPLEFQIVSISNPSVTVRNADTGGNTFVYNQNLPLGETSSPKRMEFNDPLAQLFTFDARVYANAYTGSTIGSGTSGTDGSTPAPGPVTYSIFRQTINGQLLAGEPSNFVTGDPSPTYGDPNFRGVTWDDFPVTTRSDARYLEGILSSAMAVDMDFQVRTADGQLIMQSAGPNANERVMIPVQPNTTYVFRVLGWANGPAQFTIVSDQYLPQGSPGENAGTKTIGGGPLGEPAPTPTSTVLRLFRFSVNPLTKRVTATLLQ
jgi:Zn-dependent metalloprotease